MNLAELEKSGFVPELMGRQEKVLVFQMPLPLSRSEEGPTEKASLKLQLVMIREILLKALDEISKLRRIGRHIGEVWFLTCCIGHQVVEVRIRLMHRGRYRVLREVVGVAMLGEVRGQGGLPVH